MSLLTNKVFIGLSPTSTIPSTNYRDYGLTGISIPDSPDIHEKDSYSVTRKRLFTGRDQSRTLNLMVYLDDETKWLLGLDGTTDNRIYIERALQGRASGNKGEKLAIIVTRIEQRQVRNKEKLTVQGVIDGTVDAITY